MGAIFAVRVNFSVAALGIDTHVFNSTYRQNAQMLGAAQGNSPEEVALFLVSSLPMAYRLDANPAVVRKWIRERKVNPEDRDVMNALFNLGWDALIP